MAACLALGPAAVASHRAAAALWKLEVSSRKSSRSMSRTTGCGRATKSSSDDTVTASVGHHEAGQVPSHHRGPHPSGSGFGRRRRSARGRVRICVPAWIDGSGASPATLADLRDARKPRAGGPEKDPCGERKRRAGWQHPGSEVHPPRAQRSPATVRAPVEGARRRRPGRSHRLRLSRLTPGLRSGRKEVTHGPGGRGGRLSTPQSADGTRLEDAVLRLARRRQPSGACSSRGSFGARPASPCQQPARASG
jgi:hypothetical protein